MADCVLNSGGAIGVNNIDVLGIRAVQSVNASAEQRTGRVEASDALEFGELAGKAADVRAQRMANAVNLGLVDASLLEEAGDLIGDNASVGRGCEVIRRLGSLFPVDNYKVDIILLRKKSV